MSTGLALAGMWLTGLLRRRRGRLLGAAACIAIAVSLLAALGGFLAASKATMTDRATRAVAVDWQIQVQPGADPGTVLDQIRSYPGVRVADPVHFGDSAGLFATSGGGAVSTGPAVIVGIPDQYRQHFPGTIRTLSGADSGVLLAQQTASNLRATVGSVITVRVPGGATAAETVAGVVDLPQADSLFQTVAAPAAAQPQAPPDNVLLLPISEFDALFAPGLRDDPAVVRAQVHVARDRNLPPDPAAAYAADIGGARNLEATLAGAALVGDNLGATLDAARQDALYSQVLFLFLGLPGVALSAVLAAVITADGAPRRRQELGLLRARGAGGGQLTAVAGSEAVAVGLIGGVVGAGAGIVVDRAVLGSPVSLSWLLSAATAGVVLTAVTVLTPALRDLRFSTAAAARAAIGRTRRPLWRRAGVDFLALAAAFAVYRVTSRAGYALVLAPEGVTALSVSYWAFAGPGLLWIGTALLTLRLADLTLGRGRRFVAALLGPLAGPLSSTVAAMLARNRRALARSVAVVALAGMFALSTAVFNSTYRQQAEVDARVTNGADVTVTEPPTATIGPDLAGELRRIPGVRDVEPLQHRFAYVGADLQDLYGVDPTTITGAALLQDSYFDGGTAAQLMDRLAAQPDGVLVGAETVADFQLSPGDPVKLRIQNAATTTFETMPFRFIGVVKEFPTAPKDSFLVANAAYLTQVTANPAVGAFLIDTGEADTPAVRQAVSDAVGTGATVTDITTVRGTVGSTLTSVDLRGLTRLELGYAAVLAAAGSALMLASGFAERRRTFAIVTALGGTRRHTASIVLAEAAVVTAGGAVLGVIGGVVLSHLLVTVLSGVFDPPPATLTVPWAYLTLVAAATAAAIAAVTTAAAHTAARYPISVLRE
ncbi:ABC transporter permease [Rhodococcus koreensis]|uniref:ABC transporter permease n=1 Tax=Rhodococcus koreensis TaxID=99653 RepID=UPI00197E5728|nr:ABC transporter permease [Rhodococcus koreensis]QSE84759.1 ABC transporter permease [Rhodococcus koreensis]